jgi:hypothetical protein
MRKKLCRSCGKWLNEDEFYKGNAICKSCYMYKYNIENAERRRVVWRNYYYRMKSDRKKWNSYLEKRAKYLREWRRRKKDYTYIKAKIDKNLKDLIKAFGISKDKITYKEV